MEKTNLKIVHVYTRTTYFPSYMYLSQIQPLFARTYLCCYGNKSPSMTEMAKSIISSRRQLWLELRSVVFCSYLSIYDALVDYLNVYVGIK